MQLAEKHENERFMGFLCQIERFELYAYLHCLDEDCLKPIKPGLNQPP